MKQYTRVDAGTGRKHPLSDSDWPKNDTPALTDTDRARLIRQAGLEAVAKALDTPPL